MSMIKKLFSLFCTASLVATLYLSPTVCTAATPAPTMDIQGISNPLQFKQTYHTQTYTVGQDGKSLLYRGKDTGMRLGTNNPPGGKIKVTDPNIQKQVRPKPGTTPGTKPGTTTGTGSKLTGTLSKVGGVLSIAAGSMMVWDANAGEGARTGVDLLKAAAGGAMIGMGVASIVPGVGTVVGTVVGAVAGAATVGWQMFSETDCLIDPVTNKQTCCNTTTGDVKRKIGDYMFCQKKGGGAMAMVRQCRVGGRSQSGSGIGGWFKDLVSDDAWTDDCMERWCTGVTAPPNGQEQYIQYIPDTSKVCWKWECYGGFTFDAAKNKCIVTFCDGHGPEESEQDLPLYNFTYDEEKKCFHWECIEGYEQQDDYCVEVVINPDTGTQEESTEPLPQPEPAPDKYAATIAKIEAMLAELDAECGVGGKGNNDDTEVLEAVKDAKDMKDATTKLGKVEKYVTKAAQSVGKAAHESGVLDNSPSNTTSTTDKGILAGTVTDAKAIQSANK